MLAALLLALTLFGQAPDAPGQGRRPGGPQTPGQQPTTTTTTQTQPGSMAGDALPRSQLLVTCGVESDSEIIQSQCRSATNCDPNTSPSLSPFTAGANSFVMPFRARSIKPSRSRSSSWRIAGQIQVCAISLWDVLEIGSLTFGIQKIAGCLITGTPAWNIVPRRGFPFCTTMICYGLALPKR